MNKMAISDQSFLPEDGNMSFLLSQHFVDFNPPSFGIISMFSVENGGKITCHHRDNNVVVNGSRKILANYLAYGRLLGGDDLAGYVVDTCKFGNRGISNTVMVTTSDPSPDVTDIGLVDSSPVPVTGANFTVSGVAQQEGLSSWATTFTITMNAVDGNGGEDGYKNYSEMGLFSSNGTMYAKKNFPSYVKTNQRKLVVFWTIVF